MDVKQAVGLAKNYVSDLFATEGLANLGLEEVEYDRDGNEWIVTIGFSRPWDRPNTLAAVVGQTSAPRSFKIVRIDDTSSNVVSVKNYGSKS
jgi:hypothetical protein